MEKAISITYLKCAFVALGILFPHHLTKWHNFHKKKFAEHKIFSTTLKHFSSYKELRVIWPYMYICLHVKYLLFLSDFNETCILSTQFWKILKCQISQKHHPVEAKLFHAEGWTRGQRDTKTLIVTFRNLWSALNIYIKVYQAMCWIRCHTMKMHQIAERQFLPFVTLALDGSE